MGDFVYMRDEMPNVKSAFMDALAKKLYQIYWEWQWARLPLIAQWDESDRVYLCKRKLPEIDGMPFIDAANPWGPTDIFDAVNSWTMRMQLATFPKDDTWLTVVGKPGEDPSITNAVRAQQLWMHRQIRTRRYFGKHYRQLAIRGTSALLLDWRTETISGKVISARASRAIKRYAQQSGVPMSEMALYKQMSKVRNKKVAYNGPIVRVLDSRDVILDPEADLDYDRKIPMIIQTYRRPSDLENEIDQFGNKVYGNLDNLPTQKATELYWQGWDKLGRLQALNLLGVYPQHYATNSTDVVKVLVCYMPYIKFEGQEFYDTYFHVAERYGNVRMIRVEESPTTESGARHLLIDTAIDWFTGYPYGISMIEKLVSIYDRGAYIDALQLYSASAAAIPAVAIQSGVYKDDNLDRTPAAINEIVGNMMGDQAAYELPSTQNAAQFGMQQMQWYSQKMGGSFGTYTNLQDNPTQSITSSRKTATEVNVEAQSGNLSIDEQAEKFGPTQQEACQWMYDMSRVKLLGEPSDDGSQTVTFGVQKAGQIMPGQLELDDLDQPRSIEILGLHGAFSQQQAIQNETQALREVQQAGQMLPNGQALTQKLMQKLFSDLNIETLPTDWQTPEQLAAANPQVQQQAMQQATQNPQILMQVLLQAFQNPELVQQALLLKAQMDMQQAKAQQEMGVILSGGRPGQLGGPPQQPGSSAPPSNVQSIGSAPSVARAG